jgi:hypothetical protein
MGKLRTKIKKKVNPEKSNKMIYAVAGGLLLLIIIFLFFTIGRDKVVDKSELMTNTLKYLKRSALEVKTVPDENKVFLIFSKDAEEKDFQTIAKFAGLKLSNELGNVECTICLCRGSEEEIVYTAVLKNGQLLSEKKLE